MFWKWDKKITTLNFRICKVELKKKIQDEFELSWARGDNTGTTLRMRPDSEGVLNFEQDFNCGCTMYISKQDKSIRPKNVKIVLKRFSNPKESKVYGKLTLDVGSYFKSQKPVEVVTEMESGRSVTPVLKAIFSFSEHSLQSNNSQVDENDLSFIGETPERRINLEEWDVTDAPDIAPPPSQDDKRRSKKKHKHHKDKEGRRHRDRGAAESSDLSAATSTDVSQTQSAPATTDPVISPPEPVLAPPEPVEEPKQATEETEKPREEEERAEQPKEEEKIDQEGNTEKVQEKEEEEVKEEPKKAEEIPEIDIDVAVDVPEPTAEGGKPEEANEETKEEVKEETKDEINAEVKETKEETKEDVKEDVKEETNEEDKKSIVVPDIDVEVECPAPPPPEPERAEEAPADVMRAVISRPWPPYDRPVPLDAGGVWMAPPSLAPIVAAAAHTGMLGDAGKDVLDAFFEEVPSAPLNERCGAEQRFATLLSVWLSARSLPHCAAPAIADFDSRMEPVVVAAFRSMLSPFLISFEVILNRFATARFGNDALVRDFATVARSVRQAMRYPPAVQRAASRFLVSMVDARCAKKLLGNPARFGMTNAAMWSYFLSSVQGEGIELPLTHEIVRAMMMGANIAADQSLAAEICPHLPPATVVFVMAHTGRDDMMLTAVNASAFAAANGLRTDCEAPDPEPRPPDNLRGLADAISTEAWRKCVVDELMIELYPFIGELTAK